MPFTPKHVVAQLPMVLPATLDSSQKHRWEQEVRTLRTTINQMAAALKEIQDKLATM